MSTKPPSAGERHGILGRRTIRQAKPGSKSEGPVVGLWDLSPKAGSRADALKAIYLQALDSVDQAESRKSTALQSGKYTVEGARDHVLQFAAEKLAPGLHRARMVVDAAKREAGEMRAKIKLQPADPQNLVAAMLRAEMRDFLRSKPQAERDAYLRENSERLAPEMALALLEVPAEMSGVSPVQHGALLEKAMEAQHGDALREVQELERAIELADRATDLARGELAKEAEVSQDQFDALAAPHENKAGIDQPWLKRFLENGQEVTKAFEWDATGKSGYWRVPTAEQLEVGIVAETRDAYESMKAS